jgi:tRNA pseudouridine38-40 synthase
MELEDALSYVAAHPVTINCAGRTDTAVHASHQVIHFDSTAERTGNNWLKGANHQLPNDIALRWSDRVPATFHARFSARSRTYRYIMDDACARPALLSNGMTWVKYPLDIQAMHSACTHLLGERDFSAFRAAGCQSHSSSRNVFSADVYRSGQLIVFEICANAFLLHMVRNIVGSLIQIGLGREPTEWIRELLDNGDRNKSAATAPPNGLYLVNVEYPKQFALPNFPKGPSFLGHHLEKTSQEATAPEVQ